MPSALAPALSERRGLAGADAARRNVRKIA